MNPLISVIIPVYNTANYLDECLASVVGQTYKNLEIMLINDGSTDNSPQKCGEWAKKDPRIRYISKENEGPGFTRNLGVAKAKGEYVMFIDSDDRISEFFAEKMLAAAQKEGADIVECDYYRMALDSGIISINVNNHIVGKPFSKTERIMFGSVTPWKMLFRREFLLSNDIKQPPCPAEDMAIYPLTVALADKIVGVDEPLYYYRKSRKNAITATAATLEKSAAAFCFLFDSFIKRNIFADYKKVLLSYALRWRSRLLVRCLQNKKSYLNLQRGIDDALIKYFDGYKPWRCFLWGSYNLTKILQKTNVADEPCYRFGFSSLIAFLTLKDRDIIAPKHRNPYRSFMLQREFARQFLSVADREKPHAIVIDFIEERHDFIEYRGNFYTKSDALTESDFPIDEGRTVPRDSEEGRMLWEKACLRFIDELRRRFAPQNVILVENMLTEKYGSIHGSKQFDDIDEIRRQNKSIRRAYDFFKDNFSGIISVDLSDDELYITDKQFEYGCYPWHLNELINIKIGKKMNEYLPPPRKIVTNYIIHAVSVHNNFKDRWAA